MKTMQAYRFALDLTPSQERAALARRVEAGAARILSATVRRDGGRWYVAFTCEVQRADRVPTHPRRTGRTWTPCGSSRRRPAPGRSAGPPWTVTGPRRAPT
ncbi:hypothetical protein [Micromonospora sp. ATA51]|uniref:hypothetical protein n=1 Tax=Micromonospora sp. ATA51 TaxID=2806098 RepID=UPI001A4D2A18|nr:hypothetical protein [Micromonospora sp. ATA51]MBM0227639.1 hypothetical protein [Micromonospora sp. ATA51]